ncbi:guanine deaminase [Halopseudomonas pelagia]|uniref:guanine deaminase n=1 Tax=Halopseudomonas pelagia TaxID=553151 RepID=UPI00039B709A|nr:guanine deaminase [Halopseudomonas pelagia]
MTDSNSTAGFAVGCTAFRGPLLHFLGDPGLGQPNPASYEYLQDGLLVVADGRVLATGAAEQLIPALPASTSVEHWPNSLIVPGFIDTHVHMPQLRVMASYGTQLLEWLETYTYPTESRFADPDWSASQSQIFLNLLLAHGTTSGLVFATSHQVCADALFAAADHYNMALTTGKVMMDTHAPDGLRDTAEASYRESRELIDRWHGKGRQRYAITPRFAATSSVQQLSYAGQLLADCPGALMQTHWAENHAEIAWIRELFPERKDYLDVYDHFGLLGDHSVLAHGIHISDENRQRLAQTGTRIAFCPTSNTFLGSGLFDLRSAVDAGVQVGLASDVGGGTSLSMLVTMAEAYKVCQLRGQSLNPLKAFYMATLGNAEVLHQADQTGNLQAGKYADFLVLDRAAGPIMKLKGTPDSDLSAVLFDLMILGDDRAIRRTYIAGQCRYDRDTVEGAALNACVSG